MSTCGGGGAGRDDGCERYTTTTSRTAHATASGSSAGRGIALYVLAPFAERCGGRKKALDLRLPKVAARLSLNIRRRENSPLHAF